MDIEQLARNIASDLALQSHKKRGVISFAVKKNFFDIKELHEIGFSISNIIEVVNAYDSSIEIHYQAFYAAYSRYKAKVQNSAFEAKDSKSKIVDQPSAASHKSDVVDKKFTGESPGNNNHALPYEWEELHKEYSTIPKSIFKDAYEKGCKIENALNAIESGVNHNTKKRALLSFFNQQKMAKKRF